MITFNNNAYEASLNDTPIIIYVTSDRESICIQIVDYGHGIPEFELPNVQNGKSLKQNGNGIGLSSAISFINSINGTFRIESKENNGTTISITVPNTETPNIFAKEININAKNVIVFDDNIDIIARWQELLYPQNYKVTYFYSSHKLASWLNNNKQLIHHSIFLLDYDISGEFKTGLDLVNEFNLTNVYLVTNYAEDLWLQNRVRTMQIKLMPKSILDKYTPIFMRS